jgi:hypothetical protein
MRYRDYARSLVLTNRNYNELREDFTKAFRITTAAEELALRHSLYFGRSNRFKDLKGMNSEHKRVWQWTDTALRVPEGTDPKEYTNFNGRKYWPRIVVVGYEEKDKILVPEGNGRLVTSWNLEYGIPEHTIDSAADGEFFWFRQNPDTDNKTGKKDVAVELRWDWYNLNTGNYCFGVDASWERFTYRPDEGIRLASPGISRLL